MKNRSAIRLFGFAVAFACLLLSSKANALEYSFGGLDVTFHGYLEANVVLRDTNGFQYGFMDKVEAVQQRNTLKFDLDIYPREAKAGPISLEKIHLTYRGAYDSIFKLRDSEYGVIEDSRPGGRFNYGKRDIEWENDLREATADITYRGAAGNSFLRLGRQIVSWGEVVGVTILDKINPPDNSFQMFFLNPDDLKIPLWMARYNHSLPPMPGFNLNFDFVVIPDIRPQQFGPLDRSMKAPYVSITPLTALQGLDIREEVPNDRNEWGARVSAKIGPFLEITGSYFEGINSGPGIDLRNFIIHPLLGIPVPTSAAFTHPWTKTYGGTFSWYIPPVDLVLKGEIGTTVDQPIPLPAAAPDISFGPNGMVAKTYRLKEVTAGMLGVDKNVWARWFSDSQLNLGFQWIHTYINGWESVFDQSTVKQDADLFSFLVNWYWYHGHINPQILVFYDTQGTWMTRADVKWNITKNWYAGWQMQAFWGNQDAKSSFAPFIKTSEMTFKLGFQW